MSLLPHLKSILLILEEAGQENQAFFQNKGNICAKLKIMQKKQKRLQYKLPRFKLLSLIKKKI